MNRALWLSAAPIAAAVIAAFVYEPRHEATPLTDSPSVSLPRRTEPSSSTWATTTIIRRQPGAVTAALARPVGPKPMTPARSALLESQVPVVPTLAIDQLGSPRDRLLASTRGPTETRQAALARLSDRAAGHLAKLESERARATGEERARLEHSIAKLKRNQSLRSRVVAGTVHGAARPGASPR